ncbi:coiled-coil domain-containing protein 42 homolog [Chrysoperla carnea]|uniref:coiled-coil domain-containing protein 42 homolog n=1 Tax=Chrysoperla carnea TaxID=189513 RepID=UPI001D08942B|nr:coiled-coil domain-containing protein 42 homolog [Chrysoperla carnea]
MVVPPIDKPIKTSKTKQGAGLAPIELPKKPVYLNVREYLLSKAELKRVKKYPLWDIPRGTPATELVRARRELSDSDKRLIEKRQQHEIRRIELNTKWNELRQKEKDLRESFLKYSAFTKENADKRERTERKIKDETLVHKKLDQKIHELKHLYNSMNETKENLEKYCNDFKFYKDFLELVVQNSKEFKDVQSLLNRYETLAGVRAELAERQARDLELLESTRAQMMRITEEKNYALINFNTKVAECQIRYEKARACALKWESALSNVKKMSEMKTLEMKIVQDGAWNLYKAICARKGMDTTIDRENTEDQLIYIKQTLVDLRKIIRIAKKRAIKDMVTDEPISNEPSIEVVKLFNG